MADEDKHHDEQGEGNHIADYLPAAHTGTDLVPTENKDEQPASDDAAADPAPEALPHTALGTNPDAAMPPQPVIAHAHDVAHPGDPRVQHPETVRQRLRALWDHFAAYARLTTDEHVDESTTEAVALAKR